MKKKCLKLSLLFCLFLFGFFLAGQKANAADTLLYEASTVDNDDLENVYVSSKFLPTETFTISKIQLYERTYSLTVKLCAGDHDAANATNDSTCSGSGQSLAGTFTCPSGGGSLTWTDCTGTANVVSGTHYFFSTTNGVKDAGYTRYSVPTTLQGFSYNDGSWHAETTWSLMLKIYGNYGPAPSYSYGLLYFQNPYSCSNTSTCQINYYYDQNVFTPYDYLDVRQLSSNTDPTTGTEIATSTITDSTDFRKQNGNSFFTLSGVTGGTNTVDQQQTNAPYARQFGGTGPVGGGYPDKIAQSFIPTQTSLTQIGFMRGANVGTFTGTVTVAIQADSAGHPSGTDLASHTYTNAEWNALSTSTETTVAMPLTITIGNTYWIVYGASTADNANYATTGMNADGTNGGYANGTEKLHYNSTWQAAAGGYYDLYFKTYYGTITTLSGLVYYLAIGHLAEYWDADLGETIPATTTVPVQFYVNWGAPNVAPIQNASSTTILPFSYLNAYNTACSAAEWADSSWWTQLRCYTVATILGVPIAITDWLKTVITSMGNALITIFPFNIITNFISSWNASATTALPDNLSWFNVGDTNGNIYLDPIAGFLGTSSPMLIWGPALFGSGQNTALAAFLANFRNLTTYILWIGFIWFIYDIARGIVWPNSDEGEFEETGIDYGPNGAMTTHYRKRND